MMPQVSSELYGKHARNLMKTDVRELDGSYELDVDLPGFKKDEVNVELKNGYLTIQAAKGLDKDETDKKGKYIRQERYAGSCSRSFYVGEDVEAGEVAARFENGILQLSIPKKEHKQLPVPGLVTDSAPRRDLPPGGFLRCRDKKLSACEKNMFPGYCLFFHFRL